MSKLVSITEAAKVCDVHYITMHKALAKSGFRSKKQGSCVMFRLVDVQSLMFRPRRLAGQPVNVSLYASRAAEKHTPRIPGFVGFLAEQRMGKPAHV